MVITKPFLLPSDVILTPAKEIPESVLGQMEVEDGTFAITRPGVRTPSKMLDSNTVSLLEEFRTPKTIVEAVVQYSQERQFDPEQVLDSAYLMLQNLINANFLVPADSEMAGRIVATLQAGDRFDRFGRYEVLRCIQVLEDTELYQVRDENGQLAALKILRPGCSEEKRQELVREAAILAHLDGRYNPKVLQTGSFQDRTYIVIEWVTGVPVIALAGELRNLPSPEREQRLLALCCQILEAYSHLHKQGVIHSDVHPFNVLVTDGKSLDLIDFGLARLEGHGEITEPRRGGVEQYLEPEYVKARLEKRRPPQTSTLGEQYGVAVLLYHLLTGADYLEFSLQKEESRRQIAEDSPLPFIRRGIRPWPEVETILTRALSKNPAERFASMGEFAKAFQSIVVPEEREIQAQVPDKVSEPLLNVLHSVIRRFDAAGPLFTSGLPFTPACSVNLGAAGIAYGLYRIAAVQADPALLSLADVWATKAHSQAGSPTAFYNESDMTPEILGRVSPYHTQSGIHAVQALIGDSMVDVVSQQKALDQFVAASGQDCDNLDLTLGKSGTLLACSLLLDASPATQVPDNSALIEFGHATMHDIWQEIEQFPAIEQERKIRFLGIAHGWAGILYATMRWCQSSGAEVPKTLPERLEQLAQFAEPFGKGVRWPRKHSSQGSTSGGEYVSGWCNGSAGHIHLWTLAHEMFGEPAYLTLAEKSAWHALEDSTRTADLCCGLAGRAYGLLTMYKHTGQAKWLSHAHELANRAVHGFRATDGLQHSLYKGDVGLALLASDLTRPETACMPFFERECGCSLHKK